MKQRGKERGRKENNTKKKDCPISSSIKKSQKSKVNLFNQIIKHKKLTAMKLYINKYK
jgi:hypothetical protein